MGYNSEIFDSKQTRLVGKLFYAPKCGNIKSLVMPDNKNIVTISAEDIHTKNIRVFNDFSPILAEGNIDYAGQPVFAAFGQDIETVDRFLAQTKIEIEECISEPKAEHPVRFKNGNISKYFQNEERIVKSDYYIDSYCETLLSAQRILAKEEDNVMYLKADSQWPLHVRDTVSIALQKPKHDIYIVSETVHSEFNQLALTPSFASVIAATAAEKTQVLVELQILMNSWQPATHYHFETELDENNKIVAHKVDVEVNLGAHPIMINEICNHIMAGLVPAYKLNALSIQITPLSSNSHPIAFFADLGYGTALGATENHFNYVIHKLDTTPSEWRLDNLKSENSTIGEVTADSFFDRNHSVYAQISVNNRLGRSIMSYSRGIGLTYGQGVHGFSNKFPYISQYSASVTLNEDNKVEIGLGFQMDRHLKKVYREIVQKYFDVEFQDISFKDINDEDIKDAGPCVLSRGMGIITKMIENSCKIIKDRQTRGVPYPIVHESVYLNTSSSQYFESDCSAAVVVEMHIDTVRIIPVIDHITARIKCGKVFDGPALTDSIRHTISETISEVCPHAENNSDIDLKVRSNPKISPGSCSSLIRGLTAASLTTALSQAISYNITKIPVTENDLMEILRKQGEHHAAELHD